MLILLLLSCGKQDFPNYKDEEVVLQHEEAEENFILKFKGLNEGKSKVRAHGSLWIKGKQFYVKVVMDKSWPHQRVQQYIHTGSRCPTAGDDLNGDGVIDLHEATRASGDMLIPLDKSLSSQDRGREWFPVSNLKGIYYYSRAVSLPMLMDDLYKEDRSLEDGLIKLSRGEKLDIGRRTIILYGSPNDPLRPVACSEILPDYF